MNPCKAMTSMKRVYQLCPAVCFPEESQPIQFLRFFLKKQKATKLDLW